MNEEKYLSIITNFGCHYECPYCVVKTNGICVPSTTIEGLDTLKDAVEHEKATIISVSGGGDPLYKYHKHRAYYKKLFKICDEMNLPLEMHTSYFNIWKFPYDKCHRVVYHLRDMNDISKIKRHGNEKVRVVFVVTEDFTDDKIATIVNQVHYNRNIDELTFRQMIDKNYRVTNYCQETLRRGHKVLWYYVEQDDYNPYYVNGTIYYQFSDIGSGGEVYNEEEIQS